MPTFDSNSAALKHLRKCIKWTQHQLGKKIGVTHAQISRYETGVDKINIAGNITLKKLFEKHDIKIAPNKATSTDDLLILDVYHSFDNAEKQVVANFIFDLRSKTTEDKRKLCLEQLNLISTIR